MLGSAAPARDYPEVLRRITALVEIDGREQEMMFLTNNLEWSPVSVADLYRCRWSIEAFFKQIKQTLQLADFLGHSANAVRWQVWTALLVYLETNKKPQSPLSRRQPPISFSQRSKYFVNALIAQDTSLFMHLQCSLPSRAKVHDSL